MESSDPASQLSPDVLQMSILDGNAYDAKCLEAGQERDEDLEACSLLINNKQQALLVPSAIASHSPTAKVIVQLTVGCTPGLLPHNQVQTAEAGMHACMTWVTRSEQPECCQLCLSKASSCSTEMLTA